MRVFWFLCLSFLTFSCLKNNDVEPYDPVKQFQIDRELILNYLEENMLVATEDSTGLFYIINQPGGGGHPTPTSNVRVTYKGYFLDGTQFDGTEPGKDITFNLQNVIAGWQIGIPLLQKGGVGTFLIPSGLAYGPYGSGSIAPNTVIIFDVQLLDFN